MRSTFVPFALMTSTAFVLVALWQRSPYFAAALIGPLLAIGLYQRSNFRALRAMRLALTDPLTGLGNHRHFHERLERAIAESTDRREPLTLCLIDIDDFKRINDRLGHPEGDRCSASSPPASARTARRSGSAATSSPCSCRADRVQAEEIARSIIARIPLWRSTGSGR